MNAPVDLAFCVSSAFLKWGALAALTCAEATLPDRPVRIHVLHTGELDRDPNVAVVRRLLEDAGASVDFYAAAEARRPDLPSIDRFTSVVWLKLLIPEVLSHLDRALYVDADTMGVSSLAPLFDTDLEGNPIGAISNVVELKVYKRLEALGLDPKHGLLNSGVILMDLARLRAEDATAQALDVVRAHEGRIPWADQDVINLTFKDRWLHLHPRWNAQNSFWDWRDLAVEVFDPADLDAAVADPAIVHFEGPTVCKPWHYLCQHPYRDMWWETLRRTPWTDVQPEDRTLATRAIRLLPAGSRGAAFQRLMRVRARRNR